jgi:hypothetical protein
LQPLDAPAWQNTNNNSSIPTTPKSNLVRTSGPGLQHSASEISVSSLPQVGTTQAQLT